MNSQEQMERLVGKVLLDDDFRKRFLAAPGDVAAKEFDLKLGPETIEQIRKVNPKSLENTAEKVQYRLGLAAKKDDDSSEPPNQTWG